ncbi:hypothetical protein IWQ62_005639 [Dispira parvispora]|uniref:Uncharacterized protein n=1 Tax=Dispira parvispora TaxID=1520584 RepID=A0A9W8E4C0_9FUNG|nr:hypothetical protein IWQ62_005639 [Dispira parvispora]
MVRWLSLVLLCLYVHGTVIAMSEWGGSSSSDSEDNKNYGRYYGPLFDSSTSESGSHGTPSSGPSISWEEAVPPDFHQPDEAMVSSLHAEESRTMNIQDMESNLQEVRWELKTFQKISLLAETVQDVFRRVKDNPNSSISPPCTYARVFDYDVPVNPKDYDMDDPKDIQRYNHYNRYYKDVRDVAAFQNAFYKLTKVAKEYDTDTYKEFCDNLIKRDSNDEEAMEWYIGTLKQRISELSNELQNITSELRQEGVYW